MVPNPFAGTVSGGTLQLNNLGGTPNSFTTSASSSFTVNNGGTLTVTGGNNTDTAAITVNNGGTLDVVGTGTLGLTPTVTVSAGGVFTRTTALKVSCLVQAADLTPAATLC